MAGGKEVVCRTSSRMASSAGEASAGVIAAEKEMAAASVTASSAGVSSTTTTVEKVPTPTTSVEEGDDGDDSMGAGQPVISGGTGTDLSSTATASSWPESTVTDKVLEEHVSAG